MVISNRMKINCRKLELEIFQVQVVAFFMFWKESDHCAPRDDGSNTVVTLALKWAKPLEISQWQILYNIPNATVSLDLTI